MIDPDVLRSYIEKYRNKASVLTRIHSSLANRNSSWDLAHTVTIVVLTGFITFLGFMGTDRIFDAMSGETDIAQKSIQSKAPAGTASAARIPEKTTFSFLPARKATFDLFFNITVLLLFVASLLNLIYRWKERYTAHFQGVVKLTRFVGWLDEISLLGSPADDGKLQQIRHRYESIVEVLPPNSDKDYERAKRKMRGGSKGNSVERSDFALVERILRGSPAIMEVLLAASTISSELWLGGGSVRNAVWDYLTGRKSTGHDFDIVYFDDANLDVKKETSIRDNLQKLLPRSFHISVKNQARMHLVNREPPRASLKDAVANWPERATAMAIRLNTDGTIDIFAPYDMDDLLDLAIRPTPYHEAHPKAFNLRLTTKLWQDRWNEVSIHHPSARP